jgi:hypothetical protein
VYLPPYLTSPYSLNIRLSAGVTKNNNSVASLPNRNNDLKQLATKLADDFQLVGLLVVTGRSSSTFTTMFKC